MVNAEAILRILETEYKGALTGLNFEDSFQLLIAVILSAQCTDTRVNRVTANLFKKYRQPADFLAVELVKLEEEIKECGLFRNKAKNIRATCALLIERFNSQVPSTREELMSLPGVGRKTANVVLSQAFGEDALAVDTHVFRVSHRLGLAQGKTPFATEQELMQVIPREKWSEAHQWLIRHGRRVCKARRPQCANCSLQAYCKSNRLAGGDRA